MYRNYYKEPKISSPVKLLIAIIIFILTMLIGAAILKAIGFITACWSVTLGLAFAISVATIFFISLFMLIICGLFLDALD